MEGLILRILCVYYGNHSTQSQAILYALYASNKEHIHRIKITLDQAVKQRRTEGRLETLAHLREAIVEGASRRVRPTLMTASAVIFGLLPIMWTSGTGADVMKRIAAPMIGGMVSTTFLALMVIPALYFLWRRRELALPPELHNEVIEGPKL